MPLKLIVGLGNPGDQYVNTRHNIGFKFINAVLKIYDAPKKVTLNSHFYSITVHDQRLILIKPQTYMNLSGQAVQQVMHYYKINMDELCVVTDDLDVHFGRLRVRSKGGAGTHNGMKSIIQIIGSHDFLRLRLGIGPKPFEMDSKDFVLQNFSHPEQSILPNMLEQMASDVLDYLYEPTDILMNRINPKLYHAI